MRINTTPCIQSPKHILQEIKGLNGFPFESMLSSSDIYKHVDYNETHKRYFPIDITVRGFLFQAISADKSCQATVISIVAHFLENNLTPPSARTAGYCKARARLPNNLLTTLAKEKANKCEEKVPNDWRWNNYVLKLIDGSTVSEPDTIANQLAHPQAKTQKKGVGFPIARIVAVISYATGVLLDANIGPYAGKKTGEHALLRELIHTFKPSDIILGDSYYGTFFLIATLQELGVNAVFPLHHARKYDFNIGEKLGEKDHVVQWKKPKRPEWMSIEKYNAFPEKITVREAEINYTRKGYRSQSRVFVTTFLDEKNISTSDLKELYDYRWNIEIDLRSIKDTMGMDILRGQSPDIIQKEIWAHFLTYNLIRTIMTEAALVHGRKPRSMSFKLAMQTIFAFAHRTIFLELGCEEKIYAALLQIITHKIVGNRPGRQEPRVNKRRPKKQTLMLKSRDNYKRGELNHK